MDSEVVGGLIVVGLLLVPLVQWLRADGRKCSCDGGRIPLGGGLFRWCEKCGRTGYRTRRGRE